MRSVLFDIESTGLLRQNSQIHCIVIRDLDYPDEPCVFDDRPGQPILSGVRLLEQASHLVGHNVASYDIPLLKERYPELKLTGQVLDTLVLSRLYYPTILDRDYQLRHQGMPVRLYGRHSLEAWGHRLRCHKGDYSGGWETYTPEMLDYCIQDTAVNMKLWETMQRRMDENS